MYVRGVLGEGAAGGGVVADCWSSGSGAVDDEEAESSQRTAQLLRSWPPVIGDRKSLTGREE
ncbi:hypothetical protein OHA88_41705 [Streptomyces sp. NBC_00353]|uniref:hypothetical protein n=1 Tax=Streptomyces sp. NBC_00353 TaxID=2975722 RepID=UPI002E26191D